MTRSNDYGFELGYNGRVQDAGAANVYLRDTPSEYPSIGVTEHGSLIRLTLTEPGPVNSLSSVVTTAARDAVSLSMVMPVANLRIWQTGGMVGETSFCGAAVVDWDPTNGTAHAVQAGPVSVWVQTDGSWLPMFDSDFLNEAAFEHVPAEGLSWTDLVQALTERHHWATCPVGRFEKSITRNASAFNVEGVALFTSTVDPAGQVLGRFPDWFSGQPVAGVASVLALPRG
jgi:hypothetical protein